MVVHRGEVVSVVVLQNRVQTRQGFSIGIEEGPVIALVYVVLLEVLAERGESE